MNHYFSCLICIFLICSPFQSESQKKQANSYTYEAYKNPDQTFGYNILQNNKKLIHQPSIPGRQGMKGFKSESDARSVALLMITKLKRGIMPPTVTEDELKKLNIKP